MSKIIKYMRPFIISILAIIGLLFMQAMCDLSLPDYMSNIVNIGIQQNGIENAVPKVISKNELYNLVLFMNKKDKEEVYNNYILLDKDNISQKDYEKYVKDYPALSEEPIYKLNTKDKDVINKLNTILGKSILVVGGIEQNGLKGFASNSNEIPKGIEPGANLSSNKDAFEMISKMPENQKESILKKIHEKLDNVPESMITQSAVTYIEKQYSSLGIDISKLQTKYILYTGVIMVLIALVSMASTVLVGLLGARVASSLGRNLRRDVFKKVVSFSNSEFDKFSTASLITRSTNDIQQIQMLMVMLLRIVFYAPILAVGGIVHVLSTDTSMAWIIAVAVVSILSLVIVLFGLAIPKFKSVQKLVDKLNLVTREALTGMLVIRAFNTQKYEENKFKKANDNLTKTNLFVTRIMSLMMPMMMLIMNCITVLIVWVGAHSINDGVMQVGTMMAFIQYTMQIIMAFLMISFVSLMLPRASVSGQRIAEVLDTDVKIKDLDKLKDFKNDKKGFVEFKNVSFRYPGAEEDVLSDVTFTAEPGKTTAFIGSTGSGKSTLVNLVPRFYDVSKGNIYVDGIDIRDVSQHNLREKIGYVPQKGILFSGTIESNLKYGDSDASVGVVERAATIAQAMEFINNKPAGFNTEISQGGNNVSGGQKQRLSIARALVKDSEIYIFDDSFSALDFKTDVAIRKSLKENILNRTILLVAQRISTIMHAEQIIVLDEGRIVGKGTHKELMENCEIYKQIALSQLSKEELA